MELFPTHFNRRFKKIMFAKIGVFGILGFWEKVQKGPTASKQICWQSMGGGESKNVGEIWKWAGADGEGRGGREEQILLSGLARVLQALNTRSRVRFLPPAGEGNRWNQWNQWNKFNKSMKSRKSMKSIKWINEIKEIKEIHEINEINEIKEIDEINGINEINQWNQGNSWNQWNKAMKSMKSRKPMK